MIESKVVPFQQGADFLHARGMKLKRSGKPLDALELLRRAQENAPDGEDYRMDMAAVFADMNCHTDSRTMAVLHIFSQDSDPEAYFHLAKYATELGALPEAEKAYAQYLRSAEPGDMADEAREDMSDIRMAYGMWKQVDRDTRRRVRRLRQVRRRQMERDFAGADEIFARELKNTPEDAQIRVNRAMNLCLQGDIDSARRELEQAAGNLADYPSGIIILAAQVYFRLGETARADAVLSLLQPGRMTAQDWQMLMALQADMGRNEQAYISGSEALKIQPYDRRLLHLMAVTAFRLGRDGQAVAGFWQRILRIDPEDDVAQWYLHQLREGALTQDMLFDAYALPPVERLERGRMLLEMLNMPPQDLQAAWKNANVRRALHWALFCESAALAEPAIRVLSLIDEPEGIRYLAEFVARTRLDMDIRLSAVQAIRESRCQNWPGIQQFMQMQLIPGYQEALDSLPVCYRQTVRMAQEYLETEYDLQADIALALQCAEYLQRITGEFNRMLDLRCGAAALAALELRAAGRTADLPDVARRFDCSPRKLKYYVDYLSDMSDERE